MSAADLSGESRVMSRRAQPEADIQRAVFEHLAWRGAKDLFAFHPPSGGARRPIEAAILKGLGVVAGVPDVIIVHDGRTYGLELKSPRRPPDAGPVQNAPSDEGRRRGNCYRYRNRCRAHAAQTVGTAAMRQRLPDRRNSQFFDFESMAIRFTASVSRYDDGRLGELFFDNHKAGSAVGTLVRDLAIVFSFAVQHGADVEAIRRALCRDSQGRALGPLAAALDIIVGETR